MTLRTAILTLAAALAACGGDDLEFEENPWATGGPAPAVDTAGVPGPSTPAGDTGAAIPAGDAATEPGTDDSETAGTPTVEPSPGGTAASPPPDGWSRPPFSGPGAGEDRGVATLRAVRTARHDAYDRIVFEFEGHLPPWEVRSVEDPTACGSGHDVETGGLSAVEVDFRPAAAHTDEGRATIQDRTRSPGLPALRTARITCDFEAIVTWVLGIDPSPVMRVLTLQSPPRLVVDVRHR